MKGSLGIRFEDIIMSCVTRKLKLLILSFFLHTCPNHLRWDITFFATRSYPNFIYSDFIPNPTLSRITSHSFEHSNNCHNDLTFLMNLYYRPTISSVLTMADGGPWQRATEPKPCSNTRHIWRHHIGIWRCGTAILHIFWPWWIA